MGMSLANRVISMPHCLTHNLLLFVLVQLELGLTLASRSLCTGPDYQDNHKNCAKFEFDKLPTPCADLGNFSAAFDLDILPYTPIDDHTTKMIEIMTAVFETSRPIQNYAYIDKLDNGNGYTSGHVRFTTATNESYRVVEEYATRKQEGNILAKYLPELERLSNLQLCDKERDDTSHLEGYEDDWTTAACSDPIFVQTQRDIGHAMYLEPTLKFSAALAINSSLGKAILYDALMQHGWQDAEPLTNIWRIMMFTSRGNESEIEYLGKLLKTRRQLMCCYPGIGKSSGAYRIADQQSLLGGWDTNKDLANPVKLNNFDVTVTGNEQVIFDTANCPTKVHSNQAHVS